MVISYGRKEFFNTLLEHGAGLVALVGKRFEAQPALLGVSEGGEDFLAPVAQHARVWSKTGIPGQHVGREHPLADGDIVELHT